MKVSFVTFYTPSPCNFKAPSALPYHLLLHRDRSRFDVTIYSFNYNLLPQEQIDSVAKMLGVKIVTIPVPEWYSRMKRFPLSPFRAFLRLPHYSSLRLPQSIVNEIISSNPDALWVYTEDIALVMQQFPKSMPKVLMGPDSIAMYYNRLVESTSGLQWLRNMLMRNQYARLECRLAECGNVRCVLVGEDDCRYMRSLTDKAEVQFLVHPHYDILEKAIHFNAPKIRLLITGRRDIYNHEGIEVVMNTLLSNPSLTNSYEITMLGGDWQQHVAKLAAVGYDAHFISYATEYQAELIRHDVQIAPITQGSGTKGKVLEAMANGLLMIGTPYAMENIQAIDGKDYIGYRDSASLLKALQAIANAPLKYEQMAERGRVAIRKNHQPLLCSNQFFNTAFG